MAAPFDTRALARRTRAHVLHTVHKALASHVGSCFSCADVLAVLYGGVMRYRADNPAWAGRARLIVSKGHAAAAVYAVLAEAGFFPTSWLKRFCEDGTCLAGQPVVHAQPPRFHLGRAIEVKAGRDATLITTGGMLASCVTAATTLAASGLDVGVISMPTLKPLDERAVHRAAKQTHAVVTVEEHSGVGGLGSAVAEVLMTRGPRCRFARVALPDEVPHEVGSQEYSRRRMGDVAEAVRALVRRRSGYPA